MDAPFKAKMKNALIELKEQILKQLAQESDEFKELIQDIKAKDLADIAADDIDRKTLEVLSTQELRRLQLIESALGRLENGHYGICMSCSKKIPKERFEAIPYSFLCVECKSTEERRNR
jgi:RNA polymerase-binding protein DksA